MALAFQTSFSRSVGSLQLVASQWTLVIKISSLFELTVTERLLQGWTGRVRRCRGCSVLSETLQNSSSQAPLLELQMVHSKSCPFGNLNLFPKRQNTFLLNLTENAHVILGPGELIFSYPRPFSKYPVFIGWFVYFHLKDGVGGRV